MLRRPSARARTGSATWPAVASASSLAHEPAVAVCGPHQLGRERRGNSCLRAIVLFVGEQRERGLERFDSLVVGLPGPRTAVQRKHRFRSTRVASPKSHATRCRTGTGSSATPCHPRTPGPGRARGAVRSGPRRWRLRPLQPRAHSYPRDGLFVCELLRRDIGRELAVVDHTVGFAEAGGLGEVSAASVAIVRSSAARPELFEATPGQLVQPHALTHGHGLERTRSARCHAGTGTAAAFRAARRDTRLHGRGEDVEQLIVVGVVGHDAQQRELELRAGHGRLAQELRRRGFESTTQRFTTSSMTRSGGRTGWRVARRPRQVVGLQLLRERRDEERVAARLGVDLTARGRAPARPRPYRATR